MPINLHLFSSPGERDIRYILDASRIYLEARDDPLVAYMPLGSLSDGRPDLTEKAYKGLARVAVLNSETMTFSEMEEIVRRAHVLFIPGGNTYLLSHRLYVSRWMPYLRKKILAGLPLVAFDAGSVLCGPNILTTQDMNMLETPNFSGLNLMPFNLHTHYVDDIERDAWLSDFHVFQANPVILLTDSACLRVENKRISLLHGDAWILRKNQEKEKIIPGQEIKV